MWGASVSRLGQDQREGPEGFRCPPRPKTGEPSEWSNQNALRWKTLNVVLSQFSPHGLYLEMTLENPGLEGTVKLVSVGSAKPSEVSSGCPRPAEVTWTACRMNTLLARPGFVWPRDHL